MNSVGALGAKAWGERTRECPGTTYHTCGAIVSRRWPVTPTAPCISPHLPLGTGVGTMPPFPSGLAPHGPIVTNSSAAVGWMAQAWSKSALVAPILTATAKPCSISSAAMPITWRPTTRSSSPAQTSFIAIGFLASSSHSAKCIGLKTDLYALTFASPYASRACGSVSPIVPIVGCENTTVAMFAYSNFASAAPPKMRSARRRPAAIATGVSS
mmetsp:Transcript_4289/g.13525  ORF Transcript_4289/g.13525 Transcript_4289/m.13525 type:complete len:213 (+) Transcript_4289:235-873(+)